MRRYIFVISTVVLAGACLVLCVVLIRGRTTAAPDTSYPLLAQRLALNETNDTIINFQPLRKEVKDYLSTINVKHSFYFEYLFTGSNIRDGEDHQLVGASLMKTPIVINAYKAAEAGKVDLDKPMVIPAIAIDDKDPQYGNHRHLKVGEMITLRQAAKITMNESDNTAARIIFEATKNALPAEDQAIGNLDIETTNAEVNQATLALIAAEPYTSVLKCLYFSCLLTKADSQEILSMMSDGKAAGNDRIRAGVPNDIVVAHKMGSFSNVTQSDCGIVYVPNRQYSLCIMLDEDAASATKHIRDLSGMIYNYVQNVN